MSKKKAKAVPTDEMFVRKYWNVYHRKYSYDVVTAKNLCCDDKGSKSRPTTYHKIGGQVKVKVYIEAT